MIRSFILGAVLTVIAVAVWLMTSLFNLGTFSGMIGVGAGIVLGLIRDRSPLARFGGFLIGLVLFVLGLAATMAGMYGFIGAVVVFTIIAGLTGGRLPLWTMILGAGSMAAVYGPYLVADAWYVTTELPTALLTTLAAAAGGFIIAVIVELVEEVGDEQRIEQAEVMGMQTTTTTTSTTSATTGDTAIGGAR